MARTGKTEVVLDLKVSDKELSLAFNKVKKGFKSVSKSTRELLDLQKKQDKAAKDYLISKTKEGKAIARANKETQEEIRLATLSQSQTIKLTKAAEKFSFSKTNLNTKIQQNLNLAKEQNRLNNLSFNQEVSLKKSKERLAYAQSQVGVETLRNNKLALETQRISNLNISRDIQLAKAQEEVAFWASKKGLELAKANLHAKEAANQAKLLAVKEMEAVDSAKELSKATTDSAKGFDQMKTTAGLSGAIVTEFGRTISDMPYGLKGFGNNLSQLSSLVGLFAVNVKKSGRSMKQGFSQLGASLMGPLGLITGLQVVIALLQAGVFEDFYNWLFKTSGAFGDLSEQLKEVSSELSSQMVKLDIYTSTLKDSTKTIEQKNIAYKKLIKEFPEMESSIKKVGDEFVIAANAVSDMETQLTELAMSSAAIKKLNKISEKQLKKELPLMVKIIEKQKELNDAKNKEGKFGKLQDSSKLSDEQKKRIASNEAIVKSDKSTLKEREDAVKRVKDVLTEVRIEEYKNFTQQERRRQGRYDLIGERLSDLYDYADALENLSEANKSLVEEQEKGDEANKNNITALQTLIKLKKEDEELTSTNERAVKQYKESVYDLRDEMLSSAQDLADTSARTQKQIIEDEGKASVDKAKLDRLQFEEREKLRLQNYINQKESDKKRKNADVEAIDLAISLAKKKSKEVISESEKETEVLIQDIDKVTAARLRNQKELEELEDSKAKGSRSESVAGADLALMPEGMAKVEAEAALDELRYQNKVLAAEKELTLATTTEERKREIKDQMASWEDEKRVTDLENEINVIDEKTRIQQQYLDFVSSMSSLLGAVGARNENLRKAALIGEKSAAIASVVIQASKSISVRTAKHSALIGPAAVADAVPFAKDVARTKISAGISIAAITAGAANQLSSMNASGGSGGGGAGGSQTVQAPDFNIIGSTGVNQLAEVIGGTTKEPIKAYVVSSDVTSAQELDRNIVESASF